MAYVRRRVLVSGEFRYDVDYRDAGRKRRRTFTDPDTAAGFAASAERQECVRIRRRWPLAPLLEAEGMSPKRFAEHHSLQSSDVYRAGQHGMSDRQADHWAVAAGYHPMTIWGWTWIDVALATADLDEDPAVGEAVA